MTLELYFTMLRVCVIICICRVGVFSLFSGVTALYYANKLFCPKKYVEVFANGMKVVSGMKIVFLWRVSCRYQNYFSAIFLFIYRFFVCSYFCYSVLASLSDFTWRWSHINAHRLRCWSNINGVAISKWTSICLTWGIGCFNIKFFSKWNWNSTNVFLVVEFLMITLQLYVLPSSALTHHFQFPRNNELSAFEDAYGTWHY